MDFDGKIDMMEREDILKKLDWVIASMHDPVMPFYRSSEDYTRAWLGVVKNPYVDVLGHMGDGRYPFDYDIVLKEAAKQNKLVELNNNSFRSRPGFESNCLLIAQKCKEYGVKVVINSRILLQWSENLPPLWRRRVKRESPLHKSSTVL